MSRVHRLVLYGCIAAAVLFLFAHAREPIRLNVGDPWSEANVLSSIKYVKEYGFLKTSFTDILDVGPLTVESYRYTHYPPLSEIIYGAVGKLGVEDIAIYRLFAIAFSGISLWFLYQYLRRIYDSGIALIATTLWSTNLLWLSYADCMHQAPVLQAAGFIALWGLVRAIEDGRRAHYAVAFLGSLAAFLTSYDYILFLPAAVLMTVYLKRGNPLGRGNRHFVIVCALGCIAGIAMKSLFVIGAVGWPEFVADLKFQFLERSGSTYEHKFDSALPTLTRRLTLVFSPVFWVFAAYHAVKAIRAPSITAALKDTSVWMLLTAILFLRVFAQLAASQMLPIQVMLPFYAIGGAVLLDRMIRGSPIARLAARVALVATVLWSAVLAVTFERSFLERDDVAKVNAELKAHDHNDFMFSNLLSMGHIQAYFDRHYLDLPAADNDPQLKLSTTTQTMLTMLDQAGATSVYAAVFTTPESRFIDKSIWPLALPHQRWANAGWPNLFVQKTNALIADYDRPVMKNLVAYGATTVLHLSNFDLDRIDRTTVVDRTYARVPLVRSIDFSSPLATRHELRGWSGPDLTEDGEQAISRVVGRDSCLEKPRDDGGNACPTRLTKRGMEFTQQSFTPSADLLIRVERSCDLALTIKFAPTSARLEVALGAFRAIPPADAPEMMVMIPASAVTPGVDVIALTLVDETGHARAPVREHRDPSAPPLKHRSVGISSIEIEPRCPSN